MLRPMLLALLAAAAAAPAAALEVAVTGGPSRGPVALAPTSWNATPCARAMRTSYSFSIADPAGIDYAAVEVDAADAQPAMDVREAAVLWIAPTEREERAYRWRYEDEGRLRTQVAIPVVLDHLADAVRVRVLVKTGDGALRESPLTLAATGCR